jgi:molybdate transport system substrate-binding protein
MKRIIVAFLSVLMVILFAGCGGTQGTDASPEASSEMTSVAPEASSPGTKPELTVAAASDLSKAFTEIGAAFEKVENCTVTLTFGSTGTQTEQIANGAPFDLFAAANEANINQLDEQGLVVSDTKQLYALGRIGLATLKGNDIKVEMIEDLMNPDIKVIAIANPEHAPYGLAAKQAIESAGLWDELEPKLVYGKNITDTLSYITSGNADAGFIALSINDEATLNFSLVDSDMHKPLRQAIAVLKSTKQQELAESFIAYVLSEEGQIIMNKYGFILPED